MNFDGTRRSASTGTMLVVDDGGGRVGEDTEEDVESSSEVL